MRKNHNGFSKGTVEQRKLHNIYTHMVNKGHYKYRTYRCKEWEENPISFYNWAYSTGYLEHIKKYGFNSFVRETLFSFPDNEKGKIAAYKKEAELVNRDFLKRKDVYNLCLGGKVPSSANEKEVAQYDLNGKFLKVFYSATNASEITGISVSGIQSACSNKTKCKDFQ